jgi:hypothetical protein
VEQLSYRKKAKKQYFPKKPRGWVLGYTRKGEYHVVGTGPYVSRNVPKSAESIDLVVPIEKGVTLPVGVEARRLGKERRLIVKVPREQIGNFEVEGLDTAEFLRPTPPRRSTPRTVTEYDRQIATIRKALKKLCPTLSVKKGRGTGYSWIGIRGSGQYGRFTEKENEALRKFGLTPGGNFASISPEDREYYVKKAEKILKD